MLGIYRILIMSNIIKLIYYIKLGTRLTISNFFAEESGLPIIT